ncbi:MAG: 1-acyl-sn-glycerol-3-phosphate acyltransferase [Candidatus Moraniibacteriota bacterium]
METFDPNKGVLEYVSGLIPGLAKRLGLIPSESDELQSLLTATYIRESTLQPIIEQDRTRRAFLAATPESRALVDFLLDRLLLSLTIEGKEYLRAAFAHYRSGGHVVVMSNHTGPVDATVVWRALRELGESDDIPITFVAGQRVWESIFLRMYASYVDLVRVHSKKYLDEAASRNEVEKLSAMRNQNFAAIRRIKEVRSMYFVFPEGTGDNLSGKLKEGVPSTMAIPRALGGEHYQNVMVLPSFLVGPETIVPPTERKKQYGEDDFFAFFSSLSKGKVTCRFGSPLLGSDLGNTEEEGMYRIMCAIADLAPTEEARGRYAKSLRNQTSIAV